MKGGGWRMDGGRSDGEVGIDGSSEWQANLGGGTEYLYVHSSTRTYIM